MVSNSEIKKVNAAFQGDGLVGVFASGTGGIGEQTAYCFARYVKNPTIILTGRSTATKVQANILEINPQATVKFFKHDLALVAETRKFVAEIQSSVDKVNFICLTSGSFPAANRIETSEGIEQTFALKFLTKWLLVDGLLPQLKAAAKANPGEARVITVVGAGNEGEVDWDNIQQEKSYSFLKTMQRDSTFNTLMCMKFANENPEISFSHRYPGFVRTNIFTDAAWYLKPVLNFTLLFSTSAETSGESHFYQGVSAPEFSKGAQLLGGKLERIVPDPKLNLDLAMADRVWDYSTKVASSIN